MKAKSEFSIIRAEDYEVVWPITAVAQPESEAISFAGKRFIFQCQIAIKFYYRDYFEEIGPRCFGFFGLSVRVSVILNWSDTC